MEKRDELFLLEEGFWLGGKEHFLDHLDSECLLAFPQMGEMHGVHSREQIAATASMPGRWRDLEMVDRHAVHPVDDFALISYRAVVTRADGEPYSALVSSGYVRRSEGWRLAFHQHSPL